MARIEHSARYSKSVDSVHATFTSEQYWRERMAQIGGPGGALLGIETTDGTTTVRLEQTIAASRLPSVVTAVRPGDLVIKRSESWGPVHGGTADGTFTAAVDGAPANISGTVSLAADGTGSKATVVGEVKVKLPLFGGKIENVIAEQLGKLLDTEDRFTQQWLDTKA